MRNFGKSSVHLIWLKDVLLMGKTVFCAGFDLNIAENYKARLSEAGLEIEYSKQKGGYLFKKSHSPHQPASTSHS